MPDGRRLSLFLGFTSKCADASNQPQRAVTSQFDCRAMQRECSILLEHLAGATSYHFL